MIAFTIRVAPVVGSLSIRRKPAVTASHAPPRPGFMRTGSPSPPSSRSRAARIADAGDQEAERGGGEEMDHRHEEMQQRRHHRPDQAGDAVGRVEQAVDRLLAVAVAHQGRDGRLQRRRERHAQRGEADRGDDQQGDREAGDVVADHRQQAEGRAPPARHRASPATGRQRSNSHAAEQAGDQHGDILHAGDRPTMLPSDLDREPDVWRPGTGPRRSSRCRGRTRR